MAVIKKNETEFWVVDSHSRAETGNLVKNGVAFAFKCANLENLITQLIYLTNIVNGSLFSLVPITVQVVSENQVHLLNISFDENVSSSSNESLQKNQRTSLLKKMDSSLLFENQGTTEKKDHSKVKEKIAGNFFPKPKGQTK